MAAAEATGATFAATWRNPDDEVIGFAWGGTMCWFPRKPWTLRIVREGFAHIIRCGECPGCLEFERRRLAQRLAAQYADPRPYEADTRKGEMGGSRDMEPAPPSRLYLIRVYAPLEDHATLSHRLHRRPRAELEPGFYRLGATSFALIARNGRVLPLLLRARGIRCRVQPIRLKRGARAWYGCTAGILVARQVYGEQVNRWYCRGLPPAEREKWEVDRHASQKGYQRASSPRAWKHGALVLVPPEVWRLGRADRRSVRRDLAAATNPEGVARVMEIVHQALEKRTVHSLIGPAARPVLSEEEVKAWYASMADRRRAASVSERTENLPLPSSEKGGYASSGHSSGAPPPIDSVEAGVERGASGRPRWMERELAEQEKARAMPVEPFVPKHIPKLPEDDLTELDAHHLRRRQQRRELDEHLDGLYKRIKEGGR